MTFLKFTRRGVVAAIAGFAAAFGVTGAMAEDDLATQAEAYVQSALDEVVTALSIEDEATKRAKLRELVEKYIDTRRVALSTLGAYRRQAAPEQLKEFVPLFKEYAIALYEDQIINYGGESFKVTGSLVRSERDVIVNSKVIGGAEFDGTVVQWRVYARDGELSVVDVGAENIWLGVEQRSQFSSFIANNGGGQRGVQALIADLQTRVASAETAGDAS